MMQRYQDQLGFHQRHRLERDAAAGPKSHGRPAVPLERHGRGCSAAVASAAAVVRAASLAAAAFWPAARARTAEALQNAIDANAPAAQIKDLLAKYKASQKAKQAKLAAAHADLRKVLTVKQEAAGDVVGLLD